VVIVAFVRFLFKRPRTENEHWTQQTTNRETKYRRYFKLKIPVYYRFENRYWPITTTPTH